MGGKGADVLRVLCILVAIKDRRSPPLVAAEHQK